MTDGRGSIPREKTAKVAQIQFAEKFWSIQGRETRKNTADNVGQKRESAKPLRRGGN